MKGLKELFCKTDVKVQHLAALCKNKSGNGRFESGNGKFFSFEALQNYFLPQLH